MVIGFHFFGLLIITALIYWILPSQSFRAYLLSIVSFIFIGFYDKGAVIVVICLTIFTYLFGYLIQTRKKKLFYLIIGIITIVFVLVVFKYLGLLEKTINDISAYFSLNSNFRLTHIIPPLGISYITFKHISYLTDIKWGIVEKGSFGEFLCYSSLFTIFTAGPIERFERFRPQFQSRISFSVSHLEKSFERIVIGLFKKMVIADWVAYFVNHELLNKTDIDFGVKLLAILGFSIQIYFDFAGYSDIAIGSSLLFGIKIMENFDNPYIRPNISEFWRHWHISLSDWLRDYLFFPLSRIGKSKFWRIVVVPIAVMAICGFWHGAEWHFVLWGIWHGAGLSVYQIWSRFKKRNKKLSAVSNKTWFNILSIIFTFIFVTLGWWLFI